MSVSKFFIAGVIPLLLAACTNEQAGNSTTPINNETAKQRWYKPQQAAQGAKLFQANCAVCHGAQAEGADNWRKSGPDGKYPAPPLNGTGHGWHHPLSILFQVIKHGSPGGQGNMPAWRDKLNDDEIIATIAWFQSQWPDEIYQNWVKRDLNSRQQRQ